MSDAQVRVTAALVDHPPVVPALAFRFDAADRSIVISGDTAPSDNLIALARGADVLVHSAMFPAAIERMVARVPNATALKASILAHQTSAEDAGRVAQAAGVKLLVLSHLVPPDDPEVTDADVARRGSRPLPGPRHRRQGLAGGVRCHLRPKAKSTSPLVTARSSSTSARLQHRLVA